MNIGKSIRGIYEHKKKKYTDKEVETCLEIILGKFCEDEFSYNYIEFDIYWKDSFGEYNKRLWDDNTHSDEKNIFYYNEAFKKLKVLCKKLNKTGLKCKAMRYEKDGTYKINDGITKGGRLGFHAPWIEVKI